MVTTFSHRCVSSLILSERKSTCFEDEETEVFIEVDCFNIEPVLCPAPADLSQQQVTSLTFRYYYYFIYPFCLEKLFYCFFPFFSFPQLVRRCILGSILESEKNYLEALKRILEVWRSSCAGGHIYFFFGLFLITVFHTVCSFSNTRSPSPRLSHGC